MMIAALLLCAGGAWGMEIVEIQAVDSKKSPAGPMPLVKTDFELSDWIQRARACIAKKDYSEAIKILQALIEKEDAGFVPVGNDKTRYVSLRSEAVKILGAMPPEALERYRRFYDPKAQRKYAEAVKSGSVEGLQKVAEWYRHTSFGPQALETLAGIHFDRGRFPGAVWCWGKLLPFKSKKDQALLLTKIAVACHLAGDDTKAAQYADKLRKDHPEAKATIGGRERKLSDVLIEVFDKPAMRKPAPRKYGAVWPGWGGTPDGLGTMDECDVVLLPRWRWPVIEETDQNIFKHLVVKLPLAGLAYVRNNITPYAELHNGCVRLRRKVGNRSSEITAPAMLRPVVVGDWIIYRDEQGVVALDAYTGKVVWRTPAGRFALHRKPPGNVNVRGGAVFWGGRMLYGGGGFFADRGRYSLTVGGGKVFTIYGFSPPTGARGQNVKAREKSSSLAALSLAGEGKLQWRIGWGKDGALGSDDILKQCTYLSLPTYHSGGSGRTARLYVLAMHMENYYLLCLNPETGSLIWKADVSQTPVIRSRSHRYNGMEMYKTIGTPPAVAVKNRKL